MDESVIIMPDIPSNYCLNFSTSPHDTLSIFRFELGTTEVGVGRKVVAVVVDETVYLRIVHFVHF